MANIKLIARKAGVSISTVSRVMNGSKPVSPELKKRVCDAVEQMNYKPNSIARSLILNKTNLIGVVVPDVSDSFHSKLLSGIEECAASADYGVIICNVYRSLEKQQKYLNLMLERHVDAIILLHETSEEDLSKFQKNSKTPLIFASVPVEGVSIPFVGIDEVAAAQDATNYLIENGHDRIGLIHGEGIALGILRKEGYCRALGAKNISVNQDYIIQSTCSIADGYHAMEQMMQLTVPPTAVFCVSDEIAVGALDYILDHGMRVPEDVSLIGFDDIDLSQVVRPKLTTVHQPIQEIGIEAAKLAITLIEGKDEEITPMILKHSIVERESVLKRGEE
ncbi:LacI family DNA-binding transcriptional regulator [Sinanaerobacter chloroacetimidivorans]|uniref:LacI family DNA-binding transcriptional regulator n=1 Tax=Sinanaerobacter chloroacetimidivorans TaxID=2818044 RepID=A0A8J7VXD5_9FIRM|nr:LacI family DNA-binding transcriptional regulator [Sinanaerobacter chloroacetimidivorans]MBR0596509.1 LacI family DNA-binding transcriptional regulator [Sinanaerobacter chloroacetimidivorans]